MVAEIMGMDGLVVLVVLVVVLFGGAAIPKLARNLGASKSEFQKGLKEGGPPEADAASDKPATEAISSAHGERTTQD
jgi:sec-independent protein translocase protein TatA